MKELKNFHLDIVNTLFPLNDTIHKHLEELFTSLENILASESSLCYDYEYDRIICFGELISTTIISDYLKMKGMKINSLTSGNSSKPIKITQREH